ncbi:MAG: TetR family transcriptional regulator C-terminal domain-containing protein [Bacilli bacterium]|nr:TetR family transcriptional regulator C-terminal domain-containing protein [Bacilli bacterium]
MKTEHEFAAALKKMMATTPLEEISVISLSESIGVSRKTFYYHFHDIYDTLTLVFLDEKVTDNTSWISTSRDLITTIYNYYVKNALFIDATITSAGKDLFQEFIFNFCYQIILNNFLSKDNAIDISSNDKKNVARFYSYAYSNSVVYYLSTHRTKNLEGMRKCFGFINNETFDDSLKALQKEKK